MLKLKKDMELPNSILQNKHVVVFVMSCSLYQEEQEKKNITGC